MAPTVQAPLFSFISDQSLALLLPVIVYWVYSLAFHWISLKEFSWFEKYRIHDKEEETRNRVSLPEVIKAVIIQQLLQVSINQQQTDTRTDRQMHLIWAYSPMDKALQHNTSQPQPLWHLGVAFLSLLQTTLTFQHFVMKDSGTKKGRGLGGKKRGGGRAG